MDPIARASAALQGKPLKEITWPKGAGFGGPDADEVFNLYGIKRWDRKVSETHYHVRVRASAHSWACECLLTHGCPVDQLETPRLRELATDPRKAQATRPAYGGNAGRASTAGIQSRVAAWMGIGTVSTKKRKALAAAAKEGRKRKRAERRQQRRGP